MNPIRRPRLGVPRPAKAGLDEPGVNEDICQPTAPAARDAWLWHAQRQTLRSPRFTKFGSGSGLVSGLVFKTSGGCPRGGPGGFDSHALPPIADPCPTHVKASSSEEVLAEIRGFVVATFRRGRGQGLGPTTPLLSSGIVDSAGVLQVVRFLQNRFHIRIADEEIVKGNFNSLAAMTALVAGKLG